jgi:hypothetical protein
MAMFSAGAIANEFAAMLIYGNRELTTAPAAYSPLLLIASLVHPGSN